ncbi:sigma-70 family RNA polymerase sigma factor [Mariprofundus erugo]|uniref:RNA polymerase sigma factor n=1 Tax=Mariprofundus erugo TaxID=2528639 RepID=A0A5R9GX43_9PROT|nr:sigma-70 family RNA polymerase sigma factor [Mariprofundus erugo]TLS68587.1 sigma-70 family RNA polymerase sigma factor [Mariprofundus erugo]
MAHEPASAEWQRVEEWIADHGDYLYRFACSRLNGDRETALDLVQETLLAAWKAHHQYQGSSSLRTWLTGILKHKIIDHMRARSRMEKLADDVSNDPASDWFGTDGHWHESPKTWSASPEALSENRDFDNILKACMDKLPPLQAQVFFFREMDGDSSEDICKNLSISPSNFHVLMHRARLSLRHCLELHWFGQQRKNS